MQRIAHIKFLTLICKTVYKMEFMSKNVQFNLMFALSGQQPLKWVFDGLNYKITGIKLQTNWHVTDGIHWTIKSKDKN